MLHIEKPMGLGDGRSGIRVEPGSTLLSPAESTALLSPAESTTGQAVVGILAAVGLGSIAGAAVGAVSGAPVDDSKDDD